MIKILLAVLVMLRLTNFADAYDFTKLTDIEACKNDPTCFVCADEVSKSISQCEDKWSYNRNMQTSDTATPVKFCPLDTGKTECRFVPGTKVLTEDFTFTGAIPDITSCKKNAGNKWRYGATNLTNKGTVIRIDQDKKGWWESEDYATKIPNNNFFVSSKLIYDKYLNSNTTAWYPGGELSNGQRRQIENRCINSPIGFTLIVTTSKTIPDNSYECPIDKTLPCVDINGNGSKYMCSSLQCFPGKNITVTDPNAAEKDLADDSPENPATNKTCDFSGAKIAQGQYLSCRKGSTTNVLADDCCEQRLTDKNVREGIKTGTYAYFTFWNPLISGASYLAGFLGLGPDIIKEFFDSAVDWLFGGICSENELKAAALKSTTDDSGNCVYLGDFCSNYRGSCVEIMGANISIWGCERPASAYCCFETIMDKALAKAAREQLGLGWGKMPIGGPGKNPCKPDKDRIKIDCRGITLDELVKLNLSHPGFKNDMKEYVNYLMKDLKGSAGGKGKIDEYLEDQNNITKNIIDFYDKK